MKSFQKFLLETETNIKNLETRRILNQIENLINMIDKSHGPFPPYDKLLNRLKEYKKSIESGNADDEMLETLKKVFPKLKKELTTNRLKR